MQDDVGFVECDRQALAGQPCSDLQFEEKVLGLFVLRRQTIEALFQLDYTLACTRNALREGHCLRDTNIVAERRMCVSLITQAAKALPGGSRRALRWG